VEPPDEALVAHLGMSGQFRIIAPGGTAQVGQHLRARLQLDDGSELQFVDQRTFGGLALDSLNEEGVPVAVAHIALDPFDPSFDLLATVARLRRRRTEVKRALLDQTVVSGIGNIYADEALWRARLHPARATERLTRAQATNLLTLASEVMSDSLVVGGTSFDELYVNVNGESGYFERSLAVYGREGEPCGRCGAPIRRISFTNRSSFFCPRCQRAPRLAGRT
jgi:formamidopyrimidine-DNA glycosylase